MFFLVAQLVGNMQKNANIERENESRMGDKVPIHTHFFVVFFLTISCVPTGADAPGGNQDFK